MRIPLACLLVALAGCASQASPLPLHAAALDNPLLREPGIHPLTLPVDGADATGLVGIPAGGSATTLVVLAKGLGTPADAWRPLMEELAARGALSVAMEYRGAPDAWKARAAVDDTLTATLALRQAHPEAKRVILYGYSMGGEVSGLLLARAPPGTFTHWLAGAGVMDLRSEWQTAVSFRPLIEAEAGGTPDSAPGTYMELSPLDQVANIAAQGLQRAYVVHGAADTVVPAEQADRMAHALADAGVPVSYTLVVSEPNAWACTPLVIACKATQLPDGPANHEAGMSKPALDLLRNLVASKPEPAGRFVQTILEGATGTAIET